MNFFSLSKKIRSLIELSQKGEVKYSELTSAVGHSTKTSRALSQMEKQEFIERKGYGLQTKCFDHLVK